MNRPFGAVDVSANLKGAVPKATTQKILLALVEKGEIVQKAYGGYRSVATFFLRSKPIEVKRVSLSRIRPTSTPFLPKS